MLSGSDVLQSPDWMRRPKILLLIEQAEIEMPLNVLRRQIIVFVELFGNKSTSNLCSGRDEMLSFLQWTAIWEKMIKQPAHTCSFNADKTVLKL